MVTVTFFIPTMSSSCDFLFEHNNTKLSLGYDGISLDGNHEEAAMAIYEFMEYSYTRYKTSPSEYPTGFTASKIDMSWKDGKFQLKYLDQTIPNIFIKIDTAFNKICKMKAFI